MKSIGRSLARDYPDTNEQVGAFAAPFRDHFVRHSRKTILLLLGTVAVLLLIGCANLANLLITRAAERAKEVAVRAALGAGRWPILRRFLWESLLLCGMGSLLGLFFAPLTFHSLAHFAPGALTGARTLDIDWRVAGFTFLLAAFTTAAFGLLPALQLRSLDIVDSLKRSARTVTSAAGAGRVRAVLVCAEVSLAFVLLIGAGLLIRAFASVRAVEPGFSTSNILVVRTPMPRGEGGAKTIAALQSELRRSIEALSGVVSAGFTNNIPILQKGNFSSVRVEGGDPGRTIQCLARTASPGYFSALGIPVTRGRAFDERDADGAPYTVIVSQSLANLAWPGQNPLGRKLVFTEKANATVVGVAADIRQQGLEAAPHPEFYISSLQAGFTSSSIVIRTSVEPTSLVPQVRATIRSFNPEQPITELASMEDVLEREVFQRRLQTTLLAGFASLALLLAALGLYGVLSHLVGQKTPEIGLRAALGAAPSDILGRILSQALRLTAAGLAIGLGVSFLAVRIVESYLFNVKPTDLSTYLAVAAALLLTAALASYLPARRALRIEPIQALREE
jgi:predicted permease